MKAPGSTTVNALVLRLEVGLLLEVELRRLWHEVREVLDQLGERVWRLRGGVREARVRDEGEDLLRLVCDREK